MKKTLLSLTCAALLTGVAATASASDWEISGNAALTSNYVFRGWTQTAEKPTLQAGVDLNHSSGFFVGGWFSGLEDSANYGQHEIDIYAGWSGEITENGPELTLQALRYIYPGSTAGDPDTNEYSAALSYDFGAAAVNAGIAYSDDYFVNEDEAFYYNLGVDIPVGPVTVGLHAGFTEFDTLTTDEQDYSVTFSGEAGGFGLSLAFTKLEIDNSSYDEDNVSFTVSKEF